MKRIAIVAVTGLLALAACEDSGDTEPAPTSDERTAVEEETAEDSAPSSEAAPVTAAAATGPPQLTEDAVAISVAGATRYIEFYFDSLNYALQHPEPGLIDPWGVPPCSPCTSFEQLVDELAEEGLRYDNDFAIIASAEVYHQTTAGGDLIVDLPETNLVDADGTIVETRPAQSNVEVSIRLDQAGNQWRVFWLSGLEPPER